MRVEGRLSFLSVGVGCDDRFVDGILSSDGCGFVLRAEDVVGAA